jgi:hypothetical protein
MDRSLKIMRDIELLIQTKSKEKARENQTDKLESVSLSQFWSNW